MARHSKYDESYRRQAVAMVQEGRPAAAVARELGIHVNYLYDWLKASRPESPSGNEESLARQYAKLQKEHARLQMEHEILKKAVGIFSRPPK